MSLVREFSMPSDTEIMFVRGFAGELAQIWAMWTQAEHLRQWWGPTDWTDAGLRGGFPPGRRLVLLHARSGRQSLLRQNGL